MMCQGCEAGEGLKRGEKTREGDFDKLGRR